MSPKKTKGLINQTNKRTQSTLLRKEGISKTPCLSPTAENGLEQGSAGGEGRLGEAFQLQEAAGQAGPRELASWRACGNKILHTCSPAPTSCLSLWVAGAWRVQQENLRGSTFEKTSPALQQIPKCKQLELRSEKWVMWVMAAPGLQRPLGYKAPVLPFTGYVILGKLPCLSYSVKIRWNVSNCHFLRRKLQP